MNDFELTVSDLYNIIMYFKIYISRTCWEYFVFDYFVS